MVIFYLFIVPQQTSAIIRVWLKWLKKHWLLQAKVSQHKKITILLDNAYHKEKLETELKKIYPQILTKTKIQITPKPTKDPNNLGFKPVHKRWVTERINAWIQKCRTLWKNCEKLIETSVAKLHLCTIRLQIKRLARG